MDQATHSKIVSFRAELGDGLFEDHNVFRGRVDETLTRLNLKLSTSELKLLFRAVSWRVESAQPVVAKVYKRGKAEPDPLHGRHDRTLDEIRADILAVEREAEGLLDELVQGASR